MTDDKHWSTKFIELIDVVFIHDFHNFDQVIIGHLNVSGVMNWGGTVILHNCLPGSRESTERKRLG